MKISELVVYFLPVISFLAAYVALLGGTRKKGRHGILGLNCRGWVTLSIATVTLLLTIFQIYDSRNTDRERERERTRVQVIAYQELSDRLLELCEALPRNSEIWDDKGMPLSKPLAEGGPRVLECRNQILEVLTIYHEYFDADTISDTHEVINHYLLFALELFNKLPNATWNDVVQTTHDLEDLPEYAKGLSNTLLRKPIFIYRVVRIDEAMFTNIIEPHLAYGSTLTATGLAIIPPPSRLGHALQTGSDFAVLLNGKVVALGNEASCNAYARGDSHPTNWNLEDWRYSIFEGNHEEAKPGPIAPK